MTSLNIPSEIDALAQLADFTQDLAAAGELTSARAYGLRLAADELATNVIVHGYGEGNPGVLTIDGGVDQESVWLRLIDSAPPFDPNTQSPPADVQTPLRERRPGGLGLHLVRSVVDEFRYEFVDGQNRQTIVIQRGGVPDRRP
jgi:anti-sigma regulatory factor (Ser/Thr protein kinase)